MGKIAVTRGYLAKEFERDKETISRWLQCVDINHNEALCPSEIERFFLKYGNTAQLQKHGIGKQQALFK